MGLPICITDDMKFNLSVRFNGDPPSVPAWFFQVILMYSCFFYGGGLTHGAWSSPPSHNNLGALFASRGILTVIPRRSPNWRSMGRRTGGMDEFVSVERLNNDQL